MFCTKRPLTRESQPQDSDSEEKMATFNEAYGPTDTCKKYVPECVPPPASEVHSPGGDVGESWTFKGPGAYLPPRNTVLHCRQRWKDMEEYLHPAPLLVGVPWRSVEDAMRQEQEDRKMKAKVWHVCRSAMRMPFELYRHLSNMLF